MTDKIILGRKEIEDAIDTLYIETFSGEPYIAGTRKILALLDKAEVGEPVAKIVYDRKADENGFIYHKSRPQICSLIRDEKLLNYEHNTKLYTSPPNQSAKIAELEAEIARLNAIT